MAIAQNTKVEGAISRADTDTLAMAYALMKVAEALKGLEGQTPALVTALTMIANAIEDGTDKIANAITNRP